MSKKKQLKQIARKAVEGQWNVDWLMTELGKIYYDCFAFDWAYGNLRVLVDFSFCLFFRIENDETIIEFRGIKVNNKERLKFFLIRNLKKLDFFHNLCYTIYIN